MPKKDNFWTDKNVKTLTTMWNKGKTAADIADSLGGITRNAVIGKANRLGLEKRPSPIKVPKATKKPSAGSKTKKAKSKPATATKAKESKVISKPKSNVTAPRIIDDKDVVAPENAFSILDIKESMCRWPLGDPKEEGFHFCGRKALEGCSYCELHANKAYQVPTKRK